MNKKGAAVNAFLLGLALVVAIGAGGYWLYTQLGDGTTGNIRGGGTLVNIPSSCPDDGDSTLTTTVVNVLNTTGTQIFNVTGYLYGASTGDFQAITNTDGGTATLNCGDVYTFCPVNANAAGGDHSKVRSIVVGPGATILSSGDDEGCVEFTPTSSAYTLRLGMEPHNVLTFRAYDLDQSAYIRDKGDNETATYEGDGVTFVSTVDNNSATAVGVGGSIHYQIDVRNAGAAADFNDYYTLILLEAPVATWTEPTLKVDGTKLSDIKATGLTDDETKQFSGYEYVYKIDKPLLDGGDGWTIDYYMEALPGVNPSVDPEMDFASAGRQLSVDGVSTLVGAADDTATSAVSYTVMDVTFDIS